MPVSKGIKVALPGYDAFTDQNPDHFALFVDNQVDYVLIKEKEFDVITDVASPTGATINHDLGYVPFVLVFVEVSSGVWRKVFSTPVDGSGFWFEVNEDDLELKNTSGSTKNFAYHLFYDNVAGSSSNNLNLKGQALIKVAKIGVNAELATDPNDFIFHSNFNTFKIIAEATKNITLLASTNNQSFSEAHGLSFIPLPAAYAKRSGVDQVFLPNGVDVELWGPKLGWVGDVTFNYVQTNATNITFNFSNAKGSTVDVAVRYFLLEKVN